MDHPPVLRRPPFGVSPKPPPLETPNGPRPDPKALSPRRRQHLFISPTPSTNLALPSIDVPRPDKAGQIQDHSIDHLERVRNSRMHAPAIFFAFFQPIRHTNIFLYI